MIVTEALDILKQRLETISGLTVTTDPKAQVVVPMAIINDTEHDYNESMRRGAEIMTFSVVVFVSEADSKTGVDEARAYLSANGDNSVRAALETQLTDGDALLSKVSVDTGERSRSDNFITAEFTGTMHVPGPDPT